MASLTRWTWVWVNSGSWWWTGRPGVLRFMGSQRVGHDWTELSPGNISIKLGNLSMLENVRSWINVSYSPHHKGIGEPNDILHVCLHYINCSCYKIFWRKMDWALAMEIRKICIFHFFCSYYFRIVYKLRILIDVIFFQMSILYPTLTFTVSFLSLQQPSFRCEALWSFFVARSFFVCEC